MDFREFLFFASDRKYPIEVEVLIRERTYLELGTKRIRERNVDEFEIRAVKKGLANRSCVMEIEMVIAMVIRDDREQFDEPFVLLF
jgi:hypothetical protein